MTICWAKTARRWPLKASDKPEENAASKAWRAFMKAKDRNRFADKVVGHVPDAAAGGLAVPVGDLDCFSMESSS